MPLTHLSKLLAVLCALLWLSPVFANSERIVQSLPSGHAAIADFWPGSADGQAIIVVHGFLQTREFSTVRRLAEALADSGHNVLTPTLSLNLSHRTTSLACEAIHTHSMPQDVAEIALWTEWLQQKTGKAPVVIGHSAGSIQLMVHLASKPQIKPSQAVLISLTYFGHGPGAYETRKDAETAQKMINQGEQGLKKFSLAFCKDYVTTAEKYLSYYQWSDQKLLGEAEKINIPVTLIIGGNDKRIDKNWIDKLATLGFDLTSIPEANHFFDQAHEFDLLDAVETALESAL